MVQRSLLLAASVPVAALLLWWLLAGSDGRRSPAVEPASGAAARSDPDRAPGAARRAALADRPDAGPRDQPGPARPLTAPAPRATLRGRVTDARSARPVAGAEITWRGGAEPSATTGDDGTYALEVAMTDGLVTVTCTRADYLTARRTGWERHVRESRAGRVLEPFDFALRPLADAAALRGRVVGERGEPLAGVAVRLQPTPPTRIGPRAPAIAVERVTGADGRFAFDTLAPGRWDLLATAAGREEHDHTGIELPAGSRSELEPIRLARFGWASLRGRVVADGGTPVSGVVVRVRQSRGVREATSGPDGTFVVGQIAPGTWPVAFEHDRGLGGLGSLDFAPRQSREREIVLRGGPHFVAGQVLFGDIPAADVEVVAEVASGRAPEWMTWRASTGPDGRFRIDDLPAGRVDLSFTRRRPYALFAADDVTVDRDDQRFAFRAAPRPVVVTGTVRDTGGTGIAGAIIAPLEPQGGAARGRTGPDGRYRVELVLSSDMTDLLYAEHPTHLPGRAAVARDMIGAQGAIELDFALRPRGEVGCVEGVVTDERDRPLRGVQCICRSTPDTAAWRTHTDSRGRFRFDAVAPGQVRLLLRHRDHRSKEHAGHVDPQGVLRVAIQLADQPRFRRVVAVRGAGGEPVARARLDLWRGHHLAAATTDTTGQATLRAVPEGAVELTVEAEGYARHSLAHVVDGARDAPLVVELTRGTAILEGRVVKADGTPYVDSEVIVSRASSGGAAAVRVITYTGDDGAFRVERLRDVAHDVSVWTGSREVRRTVRPDRGRVRIVVDR